MTNTRKLCGALTIGLLAGLLAACGGGGGSEIRVSTPGDSDNSTETVFFDFSGFSEVTVGGPFNISFLQGSEFSVELTVDDHVVDLLEVEQNGQVLSIGFRPNVSFEVQTLEAVVALPSLTRITLAGATNAMFSGFAESSLEVELFGASILEGLNVHYDFLSVEAVGASLLLMEDVDALPAVHAELSAASLATFNLMDGATLTGELTAASVLSYYGSGVAIQVDTSLASTVQRLGPSR